MGGSAKHGATLSDVSMGAARCSAARSSLGEWDKRALVLCCGLHPLPAGCALFFYGHPSCLQGCKLVVACHVVAHAWPTVP